MTRTQAGALAFFLLAALLLGASGHLYSADCFAQFFVAHNLIAGNGPVLPDGDPLDLRAFGRYHDGRLYSKFGIGESLLLVPLVAVSREAGHPLVIQPRELLLASTFNTGIVMLVAVVAAWAMGGLLPSFRGRAGWALLLIFTTPLWHYAKTLFPEPLVALGLIAALGCALRGRHLFAGLVFGYAVATRAETLVLLPVWLLFYPVRGWRPAARFLIGVIPGLLLVAFYNYARYGSFLTTGFGDPDEQFSTPLILGLGGLLFSPGKSLFIYAPLLLLFPVAWLPFRRQQPRLAWLTLASFIVYTLLHAKWYAWMGGWCWGPRRLVPLLPLLFIPFAMWKPERKAWRRAFLVLALIGLGVNFLGVAVNYNDYLKTNYYRVDTIFDWRHSPVGWHFTHLLTNGDDFLTRNHPRLAVVWAAVSLGLGLLGWRRLRNLEP